MLIWKSSRQPFINLRRQDLMRYRFQACFFTPTFDLQRFLFVFTMTKNVKLAMQKPSDVNLVTKLWKTLTSFQILEVKIPEYTKLAKLDVVQVIGPIENECCFSTVIFMNIKLRNRLTMHLELVIHMFSLKTIPFGVAIQNWKDSRMRYGAKS